MSTTRTNDKAQNPEIVAKCNKATEMVKAFLQSKYSLYTEVMYLFHTKAKKGIDVDVKIGQTSFRAAIVRRTGYERTYKAAYTFLKKGRSEDDPLYGSERKQFDPMPEEEYKQLIIDIGNRNKSIKSDKSKKHLSSFVEETHVEWETLYLASDRFGCQEYDCFPVLEGWFVFPRIYDEKSHKYLDASYWEDRVQDVLKPWRNAHRITKTKSEVEDLSDDFDLDDSSEEVEVCIQNSSELSERCTLTYDDYKDYVKLYKATCRKLGGIPINFTKNYPRHQIPKVQTKHNYYDDFAAEITICHWEGIKKQIEKDSRLTPDEIVANKQKEDKIRREKAYKQFLAELKERIGEEEYNLYRCDTPESSEDDN